MHFRSAGDALKEHVRNKDADTEGPTQSKAFNSRHPTDLINGDFGALSDLSEGELSVVCGPSESHLEGKETCSLNYQSCFLTFTVTSSASREAQGCHLCFEPHHKVPHD